jgi:hypothetical protein
MIPASFTSGQVSWKKWNSRFALLVDFVDARTDRAFWRGVATATVRGAQSNQQNIVAAIRRMLDNFPPP